MAELEPRSLGRYQIVRPLARGGMAELFLARATGIQGFEKLVVVKRILPEMAFDREFVDMFLEEARLAAGLHHSNIVQVYDVGEDDGMPFFAMEYLHGEDVRSIVRATATRQERMPLEHGLSIVIGVAAGLHYAHEQRDADGRPLGLVHRDVSPHNVAVTYEGGGVKVLDFGVAKTRRKKNFTRHGTLKGKLGYMSPEQCRGDEVDRRSDVFAVGILLWELMTGRRLYGGRSDFGVMKSIVETDAPRPSLVWPECPPELEALVMRSLRREREARFTTAEELQLALEAFARERRLAVSGAGLGHWVRELFGPRAAAPPEADRSTTLYDLAPPDYDDGTSATVVDGVLMTRASDPRRHTRAVARPRRRPRLSPALQMALPVTLALALTGAAGWRVASMLRHGRSRAATTPVGITPSSTVATPPSQTMTPPKTMTPPGPTTAAPSPTSAGAPPRKLATPPAEARTLEPPRLEVAPLPPPPPPAATARAPTPSERPASHTHGGKRPHSTRASHAAPPARPAKPAHVDLDAPLPPK